MLSTYPKYSVAIRTLGTAGDKYLSELQSIERQTIPPEGIFVYIPDGYDLPKETINLEKYIRCKKGMVAQRSLPFTEIKSEYILFLDDDIFLPEDAVEKLFDALIANGADCISPNVFANHKASLGCKIINALGGTLPHFDKEHAFKIRLNSHFCYNCNPRSSVCLSESASFNVLLIRKKAYEAIHYEDECWMDKFRYALGDDQMFFYKLYKYGYKLLVHYDTGIIHLDAGAGRQRDRKEADYNSKILRYIIWYRSIYETQNTTIKRFEAVLAYCMSFFRDILFNLLLCVKYRKFYPLYNLFNATWGGNLYCRSEKYVKIPKYMEWSSDR